MKRKLTAALISLGSESSLKTIDAMKNYFDEVYNVDIREIEIGLGDSGAVPYYKGEPLPSAHCVYIKGSYKYATIAKSVASLLQGTCYLPFDPMSYTVVHNKLFTHLELQKHNISMPKTYIVATQAAAKKLLKRIQYPCIIKIPEGTQGKGVMFADSFAAASSVLDTLQSLKQPFIIQEYVETGGEDLRVIVVGDRVVAAMKRRATGGEVRSNFHVGGQVERVAVTEKMKSMCVQVASVLQSDICGVDILDGPKGPMIIEANISPGLQGIMQATQKDIPDIIAKYLYERTKEWVAVELQKKPKGVTILSSMGISSLEDETSEDVKSIITPFEFRGQRVLLPEVITQLASIKEDVEYVIEVHDRHVCFKKL